MTFLSLITLELALVASSFAVGIVVFLPYG
jgi:hypothetical protein